MRRLRAPALIALTLAPSLFRTRDAAAQPQPAPAPQRPWPAPAPQQPAPAPPPQPAPAPQQPAPAPPSPPADVVAPEDVEPGTEDVVPVEQGDEVAPAEEVPVEDVPVDDAGEPSPSRPPPRGKGAVCGVVSDAKNAEPMYEGSVTVVGRSEQSVIDYDGRYRLELPPGTYEIRVWSPLHQASRLQGVRVTLGQASQLDVQLAPDEKAEDTIVVETKADTSSVEGQLLARKRSAAVGDAMGRQEIAKTPDRNAAEAAKRVVGATIVGDRFVYVRGLGERYTNAQLNGAPLPSPEPDRQTVPLDLFPALMLDRLTIAKTFTPDVPGDFAGGSVQIRTREIPEKFLFQASAGLGFNTQSTFRERLGYQGSSTDWLGFDGGTRQLPGSIPEQKLSASLPEDELSEADRTRYGRQLNAYMSTRRELNPPNFNGSVVVGDRFDLGKNQRIGYLGAVSYARSFELRQDEIIRTYRYNDGLSLANDLKAETGTDKVRWGGTGSISYQLGDDHTLSLLGMRSQASDDEARDLEGYYESRTANAHSTRLLFVSRVLSFGQLRGEHHFEPLADAQLDWNLSLSRAEREQPDMRSVVYTQSPDSFNYLTDSGQHFFSDQSEDTMGAGLDWTQPLSKSENAPKLKAGTLVQLRDREFHSRTFGFNNVRGRPPDPDPRACPGLEWDPTCPDQLFTNDNIGTVIELDETTKANDAYTASLNVYAGYLMSDVNVTKWLRIIAGQRLEVTRQDLSSFDPFAPETTEIGSQLDSADLLPSLGTVLTFSQKTSLRGTVARTLARPQLRELAPFAFTDFFGARPIQGNPDLLITHITNYDLRFEFFPTPKEVLALSLFYKDFEDPIEEVIKGAGDGGIVTYQNAKGANVYGAELEARKSLDWASGALKDFSTLLNFTVVGSQIELAPPEEGEPLVTNTERPLSYQSPFVVNAALEYSNETLGTHVRLLYNVFGKRITQVGTQGLPDIYEQPRHTLDLTASQKLGEHFEIKGTATNLLDDDVLKTQGADATDDNIVNQYRTGRSFGVGVSYTY